MLYTDNMNAAQRCVKRGFDILVAMALLVMASPVMLAIIVVMWVKDGQHVFYSQERIGRGGRPFRIHKFRTMHSNSEEDGVPMLVSDNDTRLTSMGRWLRAHHLDELPQLWNVLVGDMSLVGYRPERRFFIEQIMEINPAYECLYQIRPGVTSPATLYNGYTDTMEKMLRRLDMDLEYMATRTLWLDVKIMVLTAWSVAAGRKI